MLRLTSDIKRIAPCMETYRIGDVGPLKEMAITGGIYRNLLEEKMGATLETGFRLFKNSPLEIRLKGDINEDGQAKFGVFGEVKF